MVTEGIEIERADMRKLLGAANSDAALLYLYLRCGNEPEQAERELQLTEGRYACAAAMLRQLGLWPEDKKPHILVGERPHYSEQDVRQAMQEEEDFASLYGEVQRQLGRSLNAEDMKILLSFVHYLGLPAEVIVMLVCYCKDRARQRGNSYRPSLRTIEKEAYVWAEQGIDTMEEAGAFIQRQQIRNSRLGNLMRIMQISGRHLTAAEERYASGWLDMGFDEEAISMAYEKTCLNTGGLNWRYMNGILTRWHEAGLHSGAQVRSGDHKPGDKPQPGKRQLDADEMEAIARMLREG